MTLVIEAVFSGLVSKVVNDITDISKDKIRKAVKNKATKHQNLESQIYNVIVDVLNKITDNRYENNQDNIYDAAEILLNSCKENKGEELKKIKSCLQILYSNVDENKCMKFKILLYEELGKDEYSELFRAILLLLLEHRNQYNHVVYEQLLQKLDEVIRILNRKDNISECNKKQKKLKSTKQEYADKWNANMFLNDFDKRDENAGVNIKLSDIYLDEHLPHYLWGENKNEYSDLKDLLSEYIYDHSKNKMLLILGQPGMGKSTLITWVINNFINCWNQIFVYQFASDLKNINWNNIDYLVSEILRELALSYKNLDGKTIILDGFDEINMGDKRVEILNHLFQKIVKENKISHFTLIITCRENYIYNLEKVRCKYIILQPWDEKQIINFCNVYQKKTINYVSENTIINILKNRKIFGIPLILYMVLALNISIEKEGSTVDVYDKIFSLEKGGLYDRCIDNKSFDNSHRIGKIKKQIHQISREIAIWMFENEPDQASIPKREYEIICTRIMQDNVDDKQDFLIGNYFSLVRHCEGIGTEELCFTHRSIYEYFVVETIYSSIENSIIKLTENSQEEFARKIVIYLKKGQITNTICEYMQFKLLKLYNSLDLKKREYFYQWWEEAIEKMMKRGMLYYTGRNIQDYINIITNESKCFLNLIKIIRTLNNNKGLILTHADRAMLERYIRLGFIECRRELSLGTGTQIPDLSKFFLRKINLSGEDFGSVNFSGANLEEVNFSRANLEASDFSNAILIRANLTDAILINANLEGADLKEAKLEGSKWYTENVKRVLPQLKKADFEYIIVEDQEKKVVYRGELFVDEKNAR